jgi:hypothetical protein
MSRYFQLLLAALIPVVLILSTPGCPKRPTPAEEAAERQKAVLEALDEDIEDLPDANDTSEDPLGGGGGPVYWDQKDVQEPGDTLIKTEDLYSPVLAEIVGC